MTYILDKYLIKIDRDKWIIPNSNIIISHDGYRRYMAYTNNEYGLIKEICYLKNPRELINFLISEGVKVNE